MGDAQFRVRGESEDYFVELLPYFSCYCGDAVFRETICKHQIAALLYEGDPEAQRLARGACQRRAAAEVGGEPTDPAPSPGPQSEDPGPPRYDWAPEEEADEEPVRPERRTLKRWW